MNLQKEIQELLDKCTKENEGELRSAFVLLSTDKNTAFLAGGDKDDLRQELTKALAKLIEADITTILVFAAALDEYGRAKKAKGEEGKSNESDTRLADAEELVSKMLSKITKH